MLRNRGSWCTLGNRGVGVRLGTGGVGVCSGSGVDVLVMGVCQKKNYIQLVLK